MSKFNNQNTKSLKACLLLGILGLGLTACGPNPSDNQTGDSPESIRRGKSVHANSDLSKSVVAIVADLSEGQALCTGSILSEDLILTAAHCVDNDPTQIHLIFSTNVKQAKPEQMRLATAIEQNPSWKNPTADKQGDLALIQFEGGLPEGFVPVQLVPKAFKLLEGEEVIFVGYGVSNSTTRSGSGVLRTTKTTVLGQQSPTEVLTDGKATSVCFGDSGGPGFTLVKGEYLQWGVASSVLNQTCNEASIHTSVMAYEPWIRAAIKQLSQKEGDGHRPNLAPRKPRERKKAKPTSMDLSQE